METTGKVWLVGAGPGDSELLTLKAKRLLDSADVIVFDRLVGKGILSLLPRTAKLIDAGKEAGNHKLSQDEINDVLVSEAGEGKRVVRLKGGDPFLFGRGAEELSALIENDIPFEVVPGVTSAIAVPECAGIPVTHRDFSSSVHIITARKKDGGELDFKSLAALDGTLVFLMGLSRIEEIAEGLIRAGKDKLTPAAVISAGTTSSQRKVVSTLSLLDGDVKIAGLSSPAVIVIGDVCALSESLDITKKLPLSGVSVALPRHEESQSSLAPILRDLGAEVNELVCDSAMPINVSLNTLYSLISSGWTVFTSPAAVHAVFAMLFERSIDLRLLWKAQFAAIGTATKNALKSHGINPDFFAPSQNDRTVSSLAALCETFETRIACAENEFSLHKALLAYMPSSKCINIPVYKVIPMKNPPTLLDNADCIALTSAAMAKALEKSFDSFDFSGMTAVCIGSKSAEAAKSMNMNAVTSDSPNMRSLAAKTVEIFGERKLK